MIDRRRRPERVEPQPQAAVTNHRQGILDISVQQDLRSTLVRCEQDRVPDRRRVIHQYEESTAVDDLRRQVLLLLDVEETELPRRDWLEDIAGLRDLRTCRVFSTRVNANDEAITIGHLDTPEAVVHPHHVPQHRSRGILQRASPGGVRVHGHNSSMRHQRMVRGAHDDALLVPPHPDLFAVRKPQHSALLSGVVLWIIQHHMLSELPVPPRFHLAIEIG